MTLLTLTPEAWEALETLTTHTTDARLLRRAQALMLRLRFPFARSIKMRAGVEEMVEAVPALALEAVEREAVGREVVVVEAEAKAAQPMHREWSVCQCRYGSCLPYISLLTCVRTARTYPAIRVGSYSCP
jgi:hypothetical protein